MSKRLEEEEEQEEIWSKGRGEDLLQLIPKRLCLSDYLVFRQVCRNWRASVDSGIATKTCFPAPQPWLLVRKAYDRIHAFSIKDQFSCVRDLSFFQSINIVDYPPVPPNYNESYAGPYLIPSASLVCLGSIGSWLIVAAHQQCENYENSTVINFFLNPLSHVRVMLPSQSTIEVLKTTFLFKKIVASSPPGLQEEDCVVAAVSQTGDLAFCRPNDAQWTVIDPRDDLPRFKDIEIFDGKLYALHEGNKLLMVFDISPGVYNVTGAHRVLGHFPVPFPYPDDREWRHPCLAADYASKEVFVVLRKLNINEGFKVYKTTEKIDGMKWEPVTDLGNRILFLSDQSSRVINDSTLGKNCIYFAFMKGWNAGFGVCSLKDSSMKQLNFPEDYSATTSHGGISQSLWFTPNMNVTLSSSHSVVSHCI